MIVPSKSRKIVVEVRSSGSMRLIMDDGADPRSRAQSRRSLGPYGGTPSGSRPQALPWSRSRSCGGLVLEVIHGRALTVRVLFINEMAIPGILRQPCTDLRDVSLLVVGWTDELP